MKTLTLGGKTTLGLACGIGIAAAGILVALLRPGVAAVLQAGTDSSHPLIVPLVASLALGALLFLGATVVIHQWTRQSLRRLSERLGSHATQVADSASLVSDSVQALTGEVMEEAISMASAQAHLKRMTEAAERNRIQAIDVQDATGRHGGAVTQGFREMQAMSRLIDEAGWAAKTMKESMTMQEAANERLIKVTKMSEELALLARNAAVAAARCGDSPEASSKVAEQVRHLAAQCVRMAHEVSIEIPNTILRRQETSGSIHRMAQAIESVAESSRRTMDRWTDALAGARDLFRSASQTVRAMAVESQGMEQLHREVGKLDGAIQSRTTLSQSTAVSTRTLRVRAARLREAFQHLRQETTPMREPATKKEPAPAPPAQDPASSSAIILWKPEAPMETETAQPTLASRRFGLRFDGLDGL